MARRIRGFGGRTEQDFRNWLYAIAANQANAYIRKTARRKRLLAEAASSLTAATANSDDNSSELDWPMLYAAILKLKPEHQTIITLRFFENMDYEQISKILDARKETMRVTVHRILGKLRKHLQAAFEGEV